VLTSATASAAARITPRPVTVSANAARKSEGQADPALSYATQAAGAGSGLVGADVLAGSLTRVAGEIAGSFGILQGSLDDAANPNYRIDYIGALLTIAPQPLPAATAAADAVRVVVQPVGEVASAGAPAAASASARVATAPRPDTGAAPVATVGPVRVIQGGIRLPDVVTAGGERSEPTSSRKP
jgi:hypothetical protein